jgi:4-hydroxybenzoate polyprenyltransferase
MAIGNYFFEWLLVAILLLIIFLMAIGGYSINDYCWLFF